jgi:chromosome segregation ATPase
MIKRLQTQLQEALDSGKAMRTERTDKEREIETMKVGKREMETKIATLEQENSQLERLFDQMYHEKLELERALQASNSSKQALKSESKQLQDQLADLHEDLQAVKTELQKAAENETLLLERNQDLEKDVKAADQTIRALESKVEELETKQIHSEPQEKDWNPLKDWMESQIITRLTSIERKIEGKSVPIAQFEDLEDRNGQLQEENGHLQAVNDSLSAELQAATERLRSDPPNKETKRLKDQLRELEETIYDLKSQLIAANTEKQQILDSQEELYHDKETFRKELQSMQQRVDEEKQALEQKLRSIKREADSSADRNQEAKARLESLGIELTKARLETMHFQIENSQIAAKLEGVFKQSPELESRTRNIAAKIERLQELTGAGGLVDAGALLAECRALSDEEEVEDLVFDQEERSDLDEKSLSGRLKNVFHTSLSSSFG